jgi:hypothetical protein
MNAMLTVAAFLVLVAVAAYVIHRLGLQHADRIAAHRYSAPRPGRRGHGAPQQSEAPRVVVRVFHRPPGRACEPSARSAAARTPRVHPRPEPGEERPVPEARDI